MRPFLRSPLILALLFATLTLPVAYSAAQDESSEVATRDLLKRPIKETPSFKKRALVIGCGSYRRVPRLRSTVKDAEAFAKFLREKWGFPEQSVILMTDNAQDENKQPEYLNIRAQVDTLLRGIDKDSDVVIFFSGHGIRADNKDFLAPVDVIPNQVEASCISATDLINALQSKKPKRAILFFDACRNVAEDDNNGGKSIAGSRGFGKRGGVAPPPQLAIVYSCEAGEQSREGKPEHFQQGVFTKYLLDALDGVREAAEDDGNVTFDRLISYVRGQVSQYVSSEYGDAQNPYGQSSFGSMVLTKAFDAPVKPVEPAQPKMNPDALVQAAYNLLIAEKYAEALAKAALVKELDPNNGHAHAIMASVQLKLGQFQDAVASSQMALRLNPDLVLAVQTLKNAEGKIAGGSTAQDPQSPPKVSETEQAGIYLKEATDLLAQGKAKEAADRARLALAVETAKDGQKAQGRLILAQSYEHAGSLDDALREFQEALRLDKSLADAAQGADRIKKKKGEADVARLLNEALVELDANNYTAAESRAREVIVNDPTNGRAHYILGRVYAFQKRYDDAITEFNSALMYDPNLVDATKGRDEANKAKAERAVLQLALEAVQHVQDKQLSQAEKKAQQILKQQTSLKEANGRAHYVLGVVFENGGRFDDAIREYQEAFRQDPSLIDAREAVQKVIAKKGSVDLMRLVQETMDLARQGQYAKAEEKAREVLARDPDNAPARYVIGQVYLSQQRWDDAITSFDQALADDPNLAEAKNAREQALKAKNTLAVTRLVDEAAQHLARQQFVPAADKSRRALTMDSNNAKAHAVLGVTLLFLDQKDEATRAIRKAEQLDGNLSLTHVGKGCAMFLDGKPILSEANELASDPKKEKEAQKLRQKAAPYFEQAAKEFQLALQIEPKDVNAHNNLGASLYYLGRLDEAEKQYERALSLDAQYAIAHFNLANVYLQRGALMQEGQQRTGLLKQAEAKYQEAIRLYPGNASFHAFLSVAYTLQGRRSDAESAAAEARRRGLRSHLAFDLLKRK